MKKLVIRGGKPLTGEITINGAKNSTVALIPAAILADSEVVLEGVPDIADVYSLIEILEDFNVKATFKDNVLTIDPTDIKSIPMPSGKIQSLRASYYFMGATLSRLFLRPSPNRPTPQGLPFLRGQGRGRLWCSDSDDRSRRPCWGAYLHGRGQCWGNH